MGKLCGNRTPLVTGETAKALQAIEGAKDLGEALIWLSINNIPVTYRKWHYVDYGPNDFRLALFHNFVHFPSREGCVCAAYSEIAGILRGHPPSRLGDPDTLGLVRE